MSKHNSPKFIINTLGLAVCVSLLGDLALFAALPVKAEILGVSLTQVGILLGFHRIIRIPGNSIGAYFINRSKRKPFLMAGMGLAVLSTAGYSLAYGFWFFLLTRLFWGIAWILIYITSMTILMDVTTPQNRGKWSGVYNTWYLVGIASGSLIFWVFVPETQQQSNGSGETIKPKPYRWWQIILQTWGKMWQHIRTIPGLDAVIVIYMVHQFAGEGVAISTFSLLLLERFGSEFSLGWAVLGAASLGGSIIALRFILSAILSPLLGKLSDRSLGRKTVILIGITAGIISFLIFAYGRTFGVILIGIVVNALSGSSLMVGLAATLGDLSPPGKQGELIGAYATAGDIGSAAGPLFAYLVLPLLSLSSVYLVCSVLFMGCLLVAKKLDNTTVPLGAEI